MAAAHDWGDDLSARDIAGEEFAHACILVRRGTAEYRLLCVRTLIAAGVNAAGSCDGTSFLQLACGDPAFLEDNDVNNALRRDDYEGTRDLASELVWENIEVVHELLLHGARLADLDPAYVYARRQLGHYLRRRVVRRLALRELVFFWIKVAAESACAPGGAGAKRDRVAYEADFC
jgi:hypothetical protein